MDETNKQPNDSNLGEVHVCWGHSSNSLWGSWMQGQGSGPEEVYGWRFSPTSGVEIKLDPLDAADAEDVVALLRAHLGRFEEVGSVLASSFRRIDRLVETYEHLGSIYLVAKQPQTGQIIGGVGVGPLAGLPISEGIGEIRELVVDSEFRGQGLGAWLLASCLREAEKFRYNRIYLETTPQMQTARSLFRKFGFRPVKHAPGIENGGSASPDKLPSYYLLETDAAS